jgi:uncharacterized protein
MISHSTPHPVTTQTARVWPLTIVFFGVALIINVLFNVAAFGSFLPYESFIEIALWIALCVPLVLIARRDPTKTGPRRLLFLAAAVMFLYGTILVGGNIFRILPGFEWYHNVTYNWAGKLLVFAFGLVFVALWPGIGWREVGFRWRLNPGSLRPVVLITLASGALFGFMPLLLPSLWGSSEFSLEALLFQLTMPGLEEELFFRGILLVLLNRALGTPWRLWGAQIGWGLVITTLVFGLVHGLYFSWESGFSVNYLPIVVTALMGFLLGWVRERSGSLIAAIILHNVVNSAGYLWYLW